MSETKSYYAVIPASVRYNENLCANSKLLYGELTALSNQEGYCWASNKYFADLYKVHKNTVSKWINGLKENGFIYVVIEKYDTGFDRKIYIRDTINENIETPKQKAEGGINEKVEPPKRKAEHNNTYNTTNNNTNNKPFISPKLEEVKDSTYNADLEKDLNEFWNLYDKKVSREKSKHLFFKINPELHDIIFEHVKEYVKSKPDKNFRKNPDTYLRNECWNDEIIYDTSRKENKSIVDEYFANKEKNNG